MKNSILAFILFICFGFSSVAQTPENFSGSLLWKISGNGLDKPSYVFGTYHLYGEELLDSVPLLKEAIANTNQLAGEIDLADMQSMQMQVMIKGLLSEEESYKNKLSEEEYKRLDEGLINFMNVGLSQLGQMKPGLISMTLATVLHAKLNPGFNPVTFEGIDQYLQRTAREEGKKIIGLETFESQMDLLLSSDSLKRQMLSLICMLENIDYSLDGLEKQGKQYREGKLYELYHDSFNNPDDPCLEYTDEGEKDKLLKDRNDNWIAQLPEIMQEPTLIVVGAGHLPAEVGILYQLHQLGYTVEAVK